MKVLYLEHPQVDLNAYNIYKGLCEVLGEENVIDFPRKIVYRGEIDTYDSPYISELRKEHVQAGRVPYGIPPFSPGEDLISGWPDISQTHTHFTPASSHDPGGYPIPPLGNFK